MSQTRCPQSRRTLCAPSARSAPLPSPLVCFQPGTTTRGEAYASIHFPASFAFLFLFAMGEAIDHALNRRDACPLTGGGVHNNDFRGNELAPQVASRQMLHPQTQMICHTNPDHDIIYIYICILTYTYLHTHAPAQQIASHVYATQNNHDNTAGTAQRITTLHWSCLKPQSPSHVSSSHNVAPLTRHHPPIERSTVHSLHSASRRRWHQHRRCRGGSEQDRHSPRSSDLPQSKPICHRLPPLRRPRVYTRSSRRQLDLACAVRPRPLVTVR